MGDSTVRKIIGGQQEPHPELEKIITKHLNKPYQKPIQDHNAKAFKSFEKEYHSFNGRELVLDLGSGTGESSYHTAVSKPSSIVISIDRSRVRLNKSNQQKPENLLVIRSDIEDFIRLFYQAEYKAHQIHLYYPNPYPKASQIRKRWYAHPVFKQLIESAEVLEVRSNWLLYIQEFSMALDYFAKKSTYELYIPEQTITAFEKKYHLDGQKLYRLISE